MVMWVVVPVKNFVVLVLHLQLGLQNYALINIIDLIDSYMKNLSTGEEVACNTLVILNQAIEKRCQYH